KHVHVVARSMHGDPVGVEFVGAVMDVTAAKAAEERIRQTERELRTTIETLRRSDEQWRDVFENNPTMYFIVDAAGKVMAVNPFGAAQLGYDVDELIGQQVFSVIHDADRDAVQRNV